MTPEERVQYQQQIDKRDVAGAIVADVLGTLEKFCQSMPLDWMFNLDNQQKGIDFIAALLHLLQEDTANIQVLSVACLQQLSMRKLEQDQWFRIISSLPSALFEASNAAAKRAAERGLPSPHCLEMLVEQLDFHKSVSKMGSMLISAHLAHITTDKDIVSWNMTLDRFLHCTLALMNLLFLRLLEVVQSSKQYPRTFVFFQK